MAPMLALRASELQDSVNRYRSRGNVIILHELNDCRAKRKLGQTSRN